ncbi:MAG: anaerobic ribonucleoside-triphosphate reductase activating protein [Candidatus Melainabacteria bacterium]|nr:anaerobic ribonucleoside-triphosphate reductase activating protein [Candidatus Melainabacteria bacterium]
MLPIKGIQKTTLIDYPDKIASIIFIGGCNFQCPYCHNRDLVLNHINLPTITEKEVFEFLNKRKKYIEGVVISGGEPTLNPGLVEFITKIKDLGLLIKIDTNGSNPTVLKELIDKIDYIAMDIKAPLGKYQQITRARVNKENIQESIDLIKNSKVDYEMRMTFVPSMIDKQDIEEIGKLLKGVKQFYIQQFRPVSCIDEHFDKIKPFSVEELREFQIILKKYIDKVEIRGFS